MSKAKYAKPGEIVSIISPTLFIRCGYPMTADDVKIKFYGEVDNLEQKVISALHPLALDNFSMNHITKAIEGAILKREGFGGKERKIFEEESGPNDWPYIKAGDVVTVKKLKFVQTGTYEHAYYNNGSWDSPPEYCPAYLRGAKTHCVYEVETSGGNKLLMLSKHVERFPFEKTEDETTGEYLTRIMVMCGVWKRLPLETINARLRLGNKMILHNQEPDHNNFEAYQLTDGN